MKTTTKIGILLIVAGIIIVFASGAAASGQIGKQILAVNMTAPPHGFAYTDIAVNSSSMFLLAVGASNLTNIYIFNGSAYGMWSGAAGNASLNAGAYAAELNSNRMLYTYGNTSFIQLVLPDKARNSTYNYTRVFGGNYYIVLDNSNGTAQLQGRAMYMVLDPVSLLGYTKGLAYGVGAAIVVIIAGIGVIVYGFVRKGGGPEGAVGETKSATTSKEYIDSLYNDIGKGKKRPRPRKRK